MTAYADEISTTLAPEMSAGRMFMRAFTRHPRMFYMAVALFPGAWDFVVHAISGDTNFADITRWRLVRMLLRALGSGTRHRRGLGPGR
jgi:hypothetical protein